MEPVPQPALQMQEWKLTSGIRGGGEVCNNIVMNPLFLRILCYLGTQWLVWILPQSIKHQSKWCQKKDLESNETAKYRVIVLTLCTKAWLHLITDLVNSHKTKQDHAFILHTYFLTLSLTTTKETIWASANLWTNSVMSKDKSIIYTPGFESCLWRSPRDLDISYNVIFTKCLISTMRVNMISNSLGYSEWHHWRSPQMSSWCMEDSGKRGSYS